jgi:carbonic anhydrase
VHAGRLNLHGWYFDMEHGQLLRYNPVAAGFELLR